MSEVGSVTFIISLKTLISSRRGTIQYRRYYGAQFEIGGHYSPQYIPHTIVQQPSSPQSILAPIFNRLPSNNNTSLQDRSNHNISGGKLLEGTEPCMKSSLAILRPIHADVDGLTYLARRGNPGKA
jgi:hypothetical protein